MPLFDAAGDVWVVCESGRDSNAPTRYTLLDRYGRATPASWVGHAWFTHKLGLNRHHMHVVSISYQLLWMQEKCMISAPKCPPLSDAVVITRSEKGIYRVSQLAKSGHIDLDLIYGLDALQEDMFNASNAVAWITGEANIDSPVPDRIRAAVSARWHYEVDAYGRFGNPVPLSSVSPPPSLNRSPGSDRDAAAAHSWHPLSLWPGELLRIADDDELPELP